MCEFYSPAGIVRRQLVTRHNVMIKLRLNIIAAGHPKRTIQCLSAKKFIKDVIYTYDMLSSDKSNEDDFLA
ncbi:unnamed protein product, partial [Rotaria magnacalcarata]